MEMASKQFFPFMELLVQLCLTLCATVSYGLWKWLAVLPVYGTACATVSYALYNCVLRLMEMASSPPRLWKWLASSPLRLWNCDCNLR
jgi:energy-converting hydrogenase Eha subunit H